MPETYSETYRRPLFALGLALACASMLALAGCATPGNNPNSNSDIRSAQNTSQSTAKSYNESELVYAISTHLGVTSESAATAIERLFKDRGLSLIHIPSPRDRG